MMDQKKIQGGLQPKLILFPPKIGDWGWVWLKIPRQRLATSSTMSF